MLSDHNKIKVKINNLKIARKSKNILRVKKILLITHGSMKKSQEKFQDILTKQKSKYNLISVR